MKPRPPRQGKEVVWTRISQTDPLPTVPTWPQFVRGFLRYRESLDEQLPDAPSSDAPYQR